MPDIPIQNGPAPSMPDWARTTLIGFHRGIAAVYRQLEMEDAAQLHDMEVTRLENLDTEVASLAAQLGLGWQPQIRPLPPCPVCLMPLILTFEQTCKNCGASIEVVKS